MAKVIVTGTAVTIKSTLKMADIKKLEELRPEALKLQNDKDEVIFSIASAPKGKSCFSKHGIMFDQKDRSGAAMLTQNNDVNLEELKNFEIAERFMPTLLPLQALEAQLTGEVMAALNADIRAAAAMIEVVDTATVTPVAPVATEE